MVVEGKTLSNFKVEFSKEAEEFIADKEFDEITVKMLKRRS